MKKVFFSLFFLLTPHLSQAFTQAEEALVYSIHLIESRIEYNQRIIQFIENSSIDINQKFLEISKTIGNYALSSNFNSASKKLIYLELIKQSIKEDNLVYEKTKKSINYDFTSPFFDKEFNKNFSSFLS